MLYLHVYENVLCLSKKKHIIILSYVDADCGNLGKYRVDWDWHFRMIELEYAESNHVHSLANFYFYLVMCCLLFIEWAFDCVSISPIKQWFTDDTLVWPNLNIKLYNGVISNLIERNTTVEHRCSVIISLAIKQTKIGVQKIHNEFHSYNVLSLSLFDTHRWSLNKKNVKKTTTVWMK